jgi:hypothetical protein
MLRCMGRHHWLLLPAMLLLMAGCNECDNGEARCEGNVAASCSVEFSDNRSPLVWHKQDCKEKLCKVVRVPVSGIRNDASTGNEPLRNEVLCVLDPEPDPRCEGRTGLVCAENQKVRCEAGYRVDEETCSRCVAGLCERGKPTPGR